MCRSEEESAHRFEVTVDDLLPVEHLQALEQRVCEASDQPQTESLEVVLLDQFIQVCSAWKQSRAMMIKRRCKRVAHSHTQMGEK